MINCSVQKPKHSVTKRAFLTKDSSLELVQVWMRILGLKISLTRVFFFYIYIKHVYSDNSNHFLYQMWHLMQPPRTESHAIPPSLGESRQASSTRSAQHLAVTARVTPQRNTRCTTLCQGAPCTTAWRQCRGRWGLVSCPVSHLVAKIMRNERIYSEFVVNNTMVSVGSCRCSRIHVVLSWPSSPFLLTFKFPNVWTC